MTVKPFLRSTHVLLALALAAACLASLAVADEPAGPAAPAATPAHPEVKLPDVAQPTTYAEAVAAIDKRTHAIGALIEDNELAKLHLQAAIIKKVADGMSKLVAKPDSGVPQAAWSEVLTASKALSAMFPRIDEAGDSGNALASRKAHADLVALVTILRKYAPVKETMMYSCPMHPEATSSAPGRCPQCGMDLVARPAAPATPKQP